jgi:catechol 2,3-dioxygenase-like lactoylglutathione lyase family enzyme
MAGLKEFRAGAVLRAEDYNRAKDFYTNVLGLEEMQPMGDSATGQGGLFRAGGGTVVSIYERPGMPAPDNTALAFEVPKDRFDAVMTELRDKGVMFEEYDMPDMGLKTVNGVAEMDGTKSAWFRDSEGNIVVLAAM